MSYEPVFQDFLSVHDSLASYASPNSRLTYMLKTGKIIKLRRGLYINADKHHYSLKTLANKLHGPSYISYEYALAYYGMIPERVEVVTSTIYNKKKSREFQTPLGTFNYRNINSLVYPYGVLRKEEAGQPFLIASREKALCDTLCKIRGVSSLKQFSVLLIDDLRLDVQELFMLDFQSLGFLASLYYQKNVRLLIEWLEKENGNYDA